MYYVKCFVFCALRRLEQHPFCLLLSQVYLQSVGFPRANLPQIQKFSVRLDLIVENDLSEV